MLDSIQKNAGIVQSIPQTINNLADNNFVQKNAVKGPFYSSDSWEEQAIKTAVDDGVLLSDGSLAPPLAELVNLNNLSHETLTGNAIEFLNTWIAPKNGKPFTIGSALVHLREYAKTHSIGHLLGDEFRFVGKRPISKLSPDFIKDLFEEAAKVNPHVLKLIRIPEFLKSLTEYSADIDGRIVSNMSWYYVWHFCRSFWDFVGEHIPELGELDQQTRTEAVQKVYRDKFGDCGVKQANGQKKGHILTGIGLFDFAVANYCQSELLDDSELQLVVKLSSIQLDKEGFVANPKTLDVRAQASSGSLLNPIIKKGLHQIALKKINTCDAPGFFSLLGELSKQKFFRQADLIQHAVSDYFNDRKVKVDFTSESAKQLGRIVKKKFEGKSNALVMLALLFEKQVRDNWSSAPNALQDSETLTFWSFWNRVISCLPPAFSTQAISLPGLRTIWNFPVEMLQTPYALSSLLQLGLREPQTALPDAPEAQLISLGQQPGLKAYSQKACQNVVIAFEPLKWLSLLAEPKFEKLPGAVWEALLKESLGLLPKQIQTGKSVLEHHPELFDDITDMQIKEVCQKLYAAGTNYHAYAATMVLFAAYQAGRKEVTDLLVVTGIPRLVAGGGRLREAAHLILEKLTDAKDVPSGLTYHKTLFKHYSLLAATRNENFCHAVLDDLLANPDLASMPEFFEEMKEILPKTGVVLPAKTFALLAKMQAYFQADDPTKSTLLKAGWRLLVNIKGTGLQTVASDLPEFFRHLCQAQRNLAVVPDKPEHLHWLVHVQRKFAPGLAHTLIPMVEKYVEAKVKVSEALLKELTQWGQEIQHGALDFELTVLLERIAAANAFAIKTPLTKPEPVAEPVLTPEQKAQNLLQATKASKTRLNIQQTLELMTALPVNNASRQDLANVLLKQYYNAKDRYFSDGILPHLKQLTHELLDAERTSLALLSAVQQIETKDFTDAQIQYILALVSDSLAGKYKQIDLLAKLIKEKPELRLSKPAQAMIQRILVTNSIKKQAYAEWLGWLELPAESKIVPAIWQRCRFLLQDSGLAVRVVDQLCHLVLMANPEPKCIVRLLAQQNLSEANRSAVSDYMDAHYTPQVRFNIQIDLMKFGTKDTVSTGQAIVSLKESSKAISCSDEQNHILLMLLLSLLPTQLETAVALSKHVRLRTLKPKVRAQVVKRLESSREHFQAKDRTQLEVLSKFASFDEASRAFKVSLYEQIFIDHLSEGHIHEAVQFVLLYLQACKQQSFAPAVKQVFTALIGNPDDEKQLALAQQMLVRMRRFSDSKEQTRECYEAALLRPYDNKQKAGLLSGYLSLVQVADADFLQRLSTALPLPGVQGLDSVWQKLKLSLCCEQAPLVEAVLKHLLPEKKTWTQQDVNVLLTVIASNGEKTEVRHHLQNGDVQKLLLQKQAFSEEEQAVCLSVAIEYSNQPEGSPQALAIATRLYPKVTDKPKWLSVFEAIRQHGTPSVKQELAARAKRLGLADEFAALDQDLLVNIVDNSQLTMTEIKELLVTCNKKLADAEWQALFKRLNALSSDPKLAEELLNLSGTAEKTQEVLIKEFFRDSEGVFDAIYTAFFHQVYAWQKKYCEMTQLIVLLLSSVKIGDQKKLALIKLALPVAIKEQKIELIKLLGAKWHALEPESKELSDLANALFKPALAQKNLSQIALVLAWVKGEVKTNLAFTLVKPLLGVVPTLAPLQASPDASLILGFIGAAFNDARLKAEEVLIADILPWLLRQDIGNVRLQTEVLVSFITKCNTPVLHAKLQATLPALRETLLNYSKHSETYQVVKTLLVDKMRNCLGGALPELWQNYLDHRCNPAVNKQAVEKKECLATLDLVVNAIYNYQAKTPLYGVQLYGCLRDLMVKHKSPREGIQQINAIVGKFVDVKFDRTKNQNQKFHSEIQSIYLKLVPEVLQGMENSKNESAQYNEYYYSATKLISILLMGQFEDFFPEKIQTVKTWIEQLLILIVLRPGEEDNIAFLQHKLSFTNYLTDSQRIFEKEAHLMNAYLIVGSTGEWANRIKAPEFEPAIAKLREIMTVRYPQSATFFQYIEKKAREARGALR